MNRIFTAILLAAPLLLGACSSTDFAPASTGPNYAQLGTIRLNAASVQVVNEYNARGTAPNVEQFLDVTPAQAINDWAKQTLIAGSNSGSVQVKIKDASVISRQLGKIGGVTGYFTKQQSEELVAHVAVEIVGEQRDLRWNGIATVEASALQTIPEGITPEVRKGYEKALVNKLVTQFATNANAAIRQHLAPMVLR